MYHVWPVSSFFTKRYHKVLLGSLWSALTAHGRNEVCRRKALFLPSLKRLIERPHSNAVSYRQKTTDRPVRFHCMHLVEDALVAQDCLWASTASSILMMSPTSKPPVSRATFQVRPKSLRLICVLASKPTVSGAPGMGIFPRPVSSVSSTTSRVTPRIVRSPITLA